MWSDRNKKEPKRFLVPRLLCMTYVGTSGRTHEAVGICDQNRPAVLSKKNVPGPETFERRLCLFWLKEPLLKFQLSFCFCNFNRTWITMSNWPDLALFTDETSFRTQETVLGRCQPRSWQNLLVGTKILPCSWASMHPRANKSQQSSLPNCQGV